MQTLNKAELAFLAILSHSQLTKRQLRLYASDDKRVLFHSFTHPHLSVMWNAYVQAIRKHQKDTGLRTSHQVIAAEISEAVQGQLDMPQELKQKCDVILQMYTSGDSPDAEEGAELLAYLVQLDTSRKLSAQITGNADLQQLQRTLDTSRQVIADLEQEQGDDQVLFQPLRDIAKLSRPQPRIPTGINWLDTCSNGGGRAGETWLILGPSGGGKTTLTIQYACQQALQGKGVLWATYEQTLQGDISDRLIAHITNTDLDHIRDRGFTNLPQDIQEKYMACVESAQDNLYAVDMTKAARRATGDPQDNGGMYTVWQNLKQLKKDGHKIETVVVDWIGAMMSIISGITGQDLDSGYRFAVQHELDVARQMEKEEGVMVIFFHQTDARQQHAKPTYLPDKTCAKDDHSLANYMDLVFTMGIKDPHDICWFSAAKTRKGPPHTIMLHLDGGTQRFSEVKGWKPDRSGNFYKPLEGNGAGNQKPAQAFSQFGREVE